MIKVLSIGNSFSDDAQRYLHQIAKNEGVDMKCMNLYIGGCSLRSHYINMIGDKKAYGLYFNGQGTGIKVKISEALESDDWDYVTLQQASHFSFDYDTYTPYIEKLAEYVRLYVPKAKLLIHQTWAYEQGSERLSNVAGFADQYEMLDKIKDAYSRAAELIGADGLIPCGEMMMKAIEVTGGRMHRDTFHADLGVGRYLLGLTWYKAMTGKCAEKDFDGLDTETTAEQRAVIREIVKNC